VDSLARELELCDECGACLDVCPTYQVTGNELLSSIARIKAARVIFQGGEVTSEVKESIYSCTECASCVHVCPYKIQVPLLVAKSRIELGIRGLDPPYRYKRVLEGFQKLSNPVRGDPEKRWEWLPEEFPRRESDTLFYVGCVPSYLVQDSALSSYLVLKKLNVDFMMIEDEGCCGIPFYDLGRIDLAREKFEENAEKFKRLGIRRIIALCPGCYYCFKRRYPEILGRVDFEVVHIIELLAELLRGKKLKLQKGKEVTYHDPCVLGRVEGIYEQPREVLKHCGVTVKEMADNRENSPCCGAGAGVNWAYPELFLRMAKKALAKTKINTIVSSCPACIINMNYVSNQEGEGKRMVYITQVVLDSLS
jgi:Fe-S oxidoreductase